MMTTSPLLKILLVFAAMLAINRARVPLGWALIAGGLGLDLWAGKSAGAAGADFREALAQADLWLLVLITLLILEFEHFLAEDRNAADILAAARRLGGRYGRAVSLMVIPAAIGLVPMPGGALFSAPLIAQTVREKSWTSEWKSAVNYWFRHVWEYWWPLYPVVIVTIPIFHLETWRFMVTLIPFSGLAVLSGYFFLVRPHLAQLSQEPFFDSRHRRLPARIWLPVLLVLLCTLALPGTFARLWPDASPSVYKLMAMLSGLLLALACVAVNQVREQRFRLFRHLFTAKTMAIASMLAGVLIFESLLELSGLLPDAARQLLASGIPVVLVVALLPMVGGLVTGNAVGFAGTSFPLIVGLMAQPGSSLTPMSTLALAFGFGYAGMMLSPVHLCFVLTRNYFSASYPSIYRQLAPCIVVLLFASIVLCVALGVSGY